MRRLMAEGIEAVRVEVLARDLGATKGSFYWHFKDRAELLDAMLAWWEANETDRFIAATEQIAAQSKRVDRLIELVAEAAADVGLEHAIFAWAARNSEVAARVVAVERKRIDYTASLLVEEGFPPDAANWWAETVYLTLLGIEDRMMRDPRFAEQAPLAEYLTRLHNAAMLDVALPDPPPHATSPPAPGSDG